MTEEKLTIDYLHFSGIEELPADDRDLAEAAVNAMKASYAPYSRFNVGAAVRLEDGTVVTGANQENAAFPSGLCAERTALFSAGASYPRKAVVEIAVAGGAGMTLNAEPVPPCGACRQVMMETQVRAGRNMSILLVGADSVYKFSRVQDLMPFSFEKL